MARLSVLTLSLTVICVSASASFDSRVEKATTYQVYASYDFDYDFVVTSALVAEVPSEFVIYHPELGKRKPVSFVIEEKSSDGYIHAIRGPPDSCS